MTETFKARIRPHTLTAGEPTTLTVELAAPPGGIAPGGGVSFLTVIRVLTGLLKGVNPDDNTNRLVSAQRSDGGATEVAVEKHPVWPTLSGLKVLVRGMPLAEGQTLAVTFGNAEQGVSASRAQSAMLLEIERDATGTGEYVPVPWPGVAVRAGEPVVLRLVAPCYAAVGVPVPLTVCLEDTKGNVCEAAPDPLCVRIDDGPSVMLPCRCAPSDAVPALSRFVLPVTFDTTGIHYVSAEDPASGLNAVSNPVKVSRETPAEQLCWGDLHVHSALSDGQGEPVDVYRAAYARGHDFVALADHGFGRGRRGSLEERIARLCRDSRAFAVPDVFVPVPGGEMGLGNSHLNLYFDKTDPEPVVRLLTALARATRGRGGKKLSSEQLAELGAAWWGVFDALDCPEFPLVPNHHTMWVGNRELINGRRQRIIEIFSVFGTNEVRDQADVPERLRMWPERIAGDRDRKYSVRELLADGHRMGFIGASDAHTGQPGQSALTAVRTRAASLPAICRAMYDRQCYATSNNRTLIEFEANGVPMGGELQLDGPLTLKWLVAGDGVLDRIDIVSNGQVLHTAAGEGGRVAESELLIEQATPGYFYLRATLADGGAAWSSPIWGD